MSKDAKREIPSTAIRLDVAGLDGEPISLSLAAVEVLACLCMPIGVDDPGPKRRLILEDIFVEPLYGFVAAREFPDWKPKELFDAVIAELRAFFHRKDVLGQRYPFVVGHDRTAKEGEIMGYSLTERAYAWTRAFVGELTSKGCMSA